jgi:hypothetical protein
LKLHVHVAPNNGDRHFAKLFNVEETKGIIHSRIYPACDVVQSVWYNISIRKSSGLSPSLFTWGKVRGVPDDNISALISCNFIIKNYVNRKITLYIYLLIFTISLWLHVKHFIALTKRECVRRIFFVITGQDYPCQHIDQWPRKTRESTTALATKKKKACVRIKRVKTELFNLRTFT